MAENKKQDAKARNYLEKLDIIECDTHSNHSIRKKISVKDEHCYIVPWQLH